MVVFPAMLFVVLASFGNATNCPESTLQEVLALPHNASIPADFFRKHNPVSLATSAVERFHHLHETPATKKHFSLSENAEIILFVDERNLGTAISTGLKNIHQTGTSGGATSARARRQIENHLLQLVLPEVSSNGNFTSLDEDLARQAQRPEFNNVAQFRPKSAYLYTGEDPSITYAYDGLPQAIQRYGSIGVKLRNQIKSRSLWTEGDSLVLFSSLPTHSIDMATGERKTLHLPIISHSFRYGFEKPLSIEDYIEVQVFGPITVDDMAAFYLFGNTSPAIVNRLESTGRPVIRVRAGTSPGGRPQIMPRR